MTIDQELTTKVLIISPFFYPELISTGKYNTCFATALQSRGFKVEVIASHPLYPDWKPSFTDDDIEGIQVFRGGHMLYYPSHTLIRRMILELWFSFHTFKHLLIMKKNKALPNIVVSIFPPSLFMLFCLMLIPGEVKKVGIIHDLQGIFASEKKGVLARLLGRAICFVEGKGFSSCEKLVFLSRAMMNEAVDAYKLDGNRCKIIYPPVSLDMADKREAQLVKCFPEGYKHIVYSGALGDKQNPEGLAELFYQTLNSVKDVMFHFFSRGPGFDRLQQAYRDKTDLIQFHDLVDEKQLPELYMRSDVQILPQRAGTSKGSLPSKLPNLIATGVRLIAITDNLSELEEILADVKGAEVINRWDVKTFVSALKVTLNDSESKKERLHRNAGLLREKFSVEALIDSIENVRVDAQIQE